MTDTGLDERLRAVERAVGDGADPDGGIAAAADAATRLDDLERRVETIERRLDEHDAGLQAVRGYAGAIRSVNETVERRANAALAAVDRLETTRAEHIEGATTERSTGRPRDAER